MRFVVIGIGAIGGVVAAALARSGQEVLAIARGPQLAAVAAGGLRLRTAAGDETVRMACRAGLDAPRLDDVILLAVKTQHTDAALDQLAAAGYRDQPLFCLQNGVENERKALRRFPNVHGVAVMMPAAYLTPGEVIAYGTPKLGIYDIGRYPSGQDAADTAVIAALNAAGIASYPSPDVMQVKHGKLLLNLGNIAEAAFGPGSDPAKAAAAVLRDEGRRVLDAAGIARIEVGEDPRRAEHLNLVDVGGPRQGGSTTQSLARGAGSIETDYLNGEIVLLGRLHGVPTPVNERFAAWAVEAMRDGAAPGAADPAAFGF